MADALSRLLRIAAEARADAADLAGVAMRLEVFVARLRNDVDDADDALVAAVALWLDHYYTAAESTLLRLVTALDGPIPGGDDRHSRLLRLASLEVASLRPALIAPSTRALLDELRSFRHKLRHSYLLDLDAARTKDLANTAARAQAALSADLAAAIAWLGVVTDIGE